MRIGIDIDGVLADFLSSYEDLIIQVSGVDLFAGEAHCVWNWPEHCGYDKSVLDHVWKLIHTSPDFWATLGTLPGFYDLSYIPEDAEVYFITARIGQRVKQQTEDWFFRPGSWTIHPTVLISEHKGLCCAALNLDKYIDDRFENCVDAATTSFAKVFLLDKPYNRIDTDLPIIRVSSLREALEY